MRPLDFWDSGVGQRILMVVALLIVAIGVIWGSQ